MFGMQIGKHFFKPNNEWEDELFNFQQTWLLWFNTLANIAMSRFIYECDSEIELKEDALEFIEACNFYTDGVMCDMVGDSPVFSGFLLTQMLNKYAIPSEIQPIYGNGEYGVPKPHSEIAYMVDYKYNPQLMYLKTDYYASLLTLCELTTVQNLNAQKHPYIITGTTKEKLTLVNLVGKLKNFSNALYLKDDGGLGQKIQALNMNVPLIMNDVQKQKRQYINEYLTFLGILNNTSEKSERLIVPENVNDNALTDTLRLKALKVRQRFCDDCNEKFNMRLSVKWNGNGITDLVSNITEDFNEQEEINNE